MKSRLTRELLGAVLVLLGFITALALDQHIAGTQSESCAEVSHGK